MIVLVGLPAAHFNLFAAFEMVDQNKKKLSIKGQAFGVGAFEEDDEDIYARDDMTRYDFTMADKSSTDKKPAKRQAIAAAGDLALDGFHAVSNLIRSKKAIFRVELPSSYEPRNWLKRKSRFSPMAPGTIGQGNGAVKIGRHDLTTIQRGAKLGETKSVVPPVAISVVSNKCVDDKILKPSVPDNVSQPIVLPEKKDVPNDNKIAHIPCISDR